VRRGRPKKCPYRSGDRVVVHSSMPGETYAVERVVKTVITKTGNFTLEGDAQQWRPDGSMAGRNNYRRLRVSALDSKMGQRMLKQAKVKDLLHSIIGNAESLNRRRADLMFDEVHMLTGVRDALLDISQRCKEPEA